MAEYLNEQEQVEVLKNFWKRYGNAILVIIVITILAMAGWRNWQNHRAAQLAAASASYESLLQSVSANQATAVTMQAQALMQSGVLPYATMAALMLAAEQVNSNQLDQARASLNWVIKHTKSVDFRAIATIRLARILIVQQKAAQAIKLLQSPVAGYQSAYALISGDAYVQLQNYAAAYHAYQTALASLPSDSYLVAIIKVKLSNIPVTASQAQ